MYLKNPKVCNLTAQTVLGLGTNLLNGLSIKKIFKKIILSYIWLFLSRPTTERLLISRYQVLHATPFHLVRVVAHAAAVLTILAREALTGRILVKAVAAHCRELTLWTDAVLEELVRSPVIAQRPTLHLRHSLKQHIYGYTTFLIVTIFLLDFILFFHLLNHPP